MKVSTMIKMTSFKFTKRQLFAATVLSISNLLGTIGSTLQPSQAVVVGQDHRVTPSYEWLTRPGQPRTAVGQLETLLADGKTYAWCTFTVVGRNIGLTNTHCLLDEQGRLPKQIKAYAVRYGSQFFASANVDIFWLGMDTLPATVGDGVHDWAIIRFTTNLGDLTGWYGNQNWSTNVNDAGQSVVGQTTNYIGYGEDWPTAAAFKPGDIQGKTPALDAGCQVLSIQSGLLLHNCDTNHGTSGSSLYSVVSDTNLRTMGLHRGAIPTSDGSLINVAVPLERFMPAIEKLRSTGADATTTVSRP